MDIKNPPFVFQDEERTVDQSKISYIKSFRDFAKEKDFNKKTSNLHLDLLPQPYIGDLKQADIFILSLNPGLNPSDYYAESEVLEFRKALIGNLRQDKLDKDFPNIFLNPNFSWHSGFNYWYGKLEGVILQLVKGKSYLSRRETLRELSRRIAFLELIPWHSMNMAGGMKNKLVRLESSRLIVDYVVKELKPRSEKNDCLLIVVRGADYWKLKNENDNIVVYEKGQNRTASLSPSSKGGDAIFHYLEFGSKVRAKK